MSLCHSLRRCSPVPFVSRMQCWIHANYRPLPAGYRKSATSYHPAMRWVYQEVTSCYRTLHRQRMPGTREHSEYHYRNWPPGSRDLPECRQVRRTFVRGPVGAYQRCTRTAQKDCSWCGGFARCHPNGSQEQCLRTSRRKSRSLHRRW